MVNQNIEKTDPDMERCSRCGLRLASPTRGTMTAWLFEGVCTCDEGGEHLLSPIQDLSIEKPSIGRASLENASLENASIENASIENCSFAPYEKLEMAGAGGMGVVYKVKHSGNGKTFALKVLRADLSLNQDARQRFEREIKAAQSVEHQNIVSIHDHGYSKEGLPYFVMDWVEGISLSRVIARDGRIKFSRAMTIFMQTAAALAHAHGRGVVHRDLKPSNIMLLRAGGGEECIKLVDFGIAKIVHSPGLPEGEDVTIESLTQSGLIFGSPLYMSPEQCLGRDMDARSDIYSFGCVMFEVLTGKPPFSGRNSVETIMAHINQPPPPLAAPSEKETVMKTIEPIVMRCLDKQLSRRYQTISELMDDLKKVQSGASPSLPHIRYHWLSLLRSFRGQAMVGALVALSIVSAVLIARSMQGSHEPPEIQAVRWKVVNHTAQDAFNNGDLKVARTHLENALILAEGANDKTLEMTTLDDLADIQSIMGSTKEAGSFKQRADAIRTSVATDSQDAKRLLMELEHLAGAATAPGTAATAPGTGAGSLNSPGAEELVRRAVSVAERLLDSGSTDSASQLLGAASRVAESFPVESIIPLSVECEQSRLLVRRGRLVEAERHLKDALSRDVHNESPVRAKSLALLGRLNMIKGKYDEAEQYLRDSLSIKSVVYGNTSIEAMSARVPLSECLVASDKKADAERVINEVSSYLRTAKIDNPLTEAKLRYSVGMVYGLPDQLKRALELAEESVPRDDGLLARCLVATGDSVGSPRGQLYYQRALSVSRRLVPADERLARQLVVRLRGN